MNCGKRIKLVRGDTGPQLRFTLSSRVDCDAIDLTTATVTLHFRAEDSSVLLFSRQAKLIAPFTDGVAIIEWAETDLDQPPGYYEGEVEIIDRLGVRETIYDVLKFEIREDFN